MLFCRREASRRRRPAPESRDRRSSVQPGHVSARTLRGLASSRTPPARAARTVRARPRHRSRTPGRRSSGTRRARPPRRCRARRVGSLGLPAATSRPADRAGAGCGRGSMPLHPPRSGCSGRSRAHASSQRPSVRARAPCRQARAWHDDRGCTESHRSRGSKAEGRTRSCRSIGKPVGACESARVGATLFAE